ncbi:tRNA/rRNA methyltransferase [Salmonella enterica subsp. enterica serovar Bareilly]
MSVVMMTLINAPITRVPGKGEAAQQSLALTVDVAPPVMSEIIRAVTVNMKLRRGAPCPARQAMKRLKKSIMVVLAVKVLSTLKFCVASVLALEDVANPHNLGGMMRSCAHFGVKGVVVQDAALLESGAAIRTAEGGAEHVQPITGESIVDVLDDFRQAGYTVVTTSSDRGQALFSTTLPEKMVLVLGREYDYLPEAAREPDDLCVKINGTGNVESLNVSVATGVLLAEWWRQNKA